MTPKVLTNPITYSFRHVRRIRCWVVYEHEGRGQRLVGSGGILATKADARAWAKMYAASKGREYAEFQKLPPPTPDEVQRAQLAECCSRVGLFDRMAADYTGNATKNTLGEAHAHQHAAESWQHAAEWCMRAAALDLSKREHYVICAQSRLKKARRSLVRWLYALGDPAPQPKLKGLSGGGEVTTPKAAHLSLVPVSDDPTTP